MRARCMTVAALTLLFAACATDPFGPDAQFNNSPTGQAVGDVNAVTPSTNEENEAKGWAHVLYVDAAVGTVTLDFDGSGQSTRRHAEGSAVGYNKKRKGARSYYPLFCTVA